MMAVRVQSNDEHRKYFRFGKGEIQLLDDEGLRASLIRRDGLVTLSTAADSFMMTAEDLAKALGF